MKLKLDHSYPRMIPVGDAAFTVEFGNQIDIDLNKQVYALEHFIQANNLPGIIEMVPSYRSLLIHFHTRQTSLETLQTAIQEILPNLHPLPPEKQRRVEIPTVYGGKQGPDLAFVAQHNQLSIEEVIEIHSSRDYPVYMMGFTPGFPYLGGMDARIAAPRLEVPRKEIRAGSVGIADHQTGIYSITSPGGWRIIGRTSKKLFNPANDPPFLLSPGDLIRFVPVKSGGVL